MTRRQISTETLHDLPPQTPMEDADAAAWAGLLGEFLGPEQDVYSRLLEKESRPGARN